MHIVLVNQYVPPDLAPTSRLLADIERELLNAGHRVTNVSSHVEYLSKKRVEKFRGRFYEVLVSHWKIFWKLLKIEKADFIFVLSSPPCVLVNAAFVSWLKGIKLGTWVMDVYPDIAVAVGEIPDGILAKVASAAMGWAYKRCWKKAVIDDDMRELLQTKYKIKEWEQYLPWSNYRIPEEMRDPSEKWIWLYSGNLGRGHDWKTFILAQQELEKKGLPFCLCFQGGGPNRLQAQKKAEELGLKNCLWRDYVSDPVDSLLEARVLIASQKNECKGMILPSKLLFMLELPRPVLWCGPKEGSVAGMLRECDQAVSPGEVDRIVNWLEELYLRSQSRDIFKEIETKQFLEHQDFLLKWLKDLRQETA